MLGDGLGAFVEAGVVFLVFLRGWFLGIWGSWGFGGLGVAVWVVTCLLLRVGDIFTARRKGKKVFTGGF